jgi:hypothetical protein
MADAVGDLFTQRLIAVAGFRILDRKRSTHEYAIIKD